jgi:uncharacterized membrane protein
MYHIRLTFDINIAEWRIDDPTDAKNAEWSLAVFDRNLGEWVNLNECTRPGESNRIVKIEVIEKPKKPPVALRRSPTDVVNS